MPNEILKNLVGLTTAIIENKDLNISLSDYFKELLSNLERQDIEQYDLINSINERVENGR